jgi:hypothetical protein
MKLAAVDGNPKSDDIRYLYLRLGKGARVPNKALGTPQYGAREEFGKPITTIADRPSSYQTSKYCQYYGSMVIRGFFRAEWKVLTSHGIQEGKGPRYGSQC